MDRRVMTSKTAMWFDKTELNDGIRFNLELPRCTVRLSLRPTSTQRLQVSLEVEGQQ